MHDYIVVGAGSAGSAIAGRLVEAGAKVLVLEAGGSDRHPFISIPACSPLAIASDKLNWKYVVEPDASRAGRQDVWPAGRVMGGGSGINGMMYIRGHRADYDRWAANGCPGWGYENVLPYLRRIENNNRGEDEFRGVDGPQSVDDTRAPHPLTEKWLGSAEAMGVTRVADLNGAAPDGADLVQATQKMGWRQTAATAYLRPLLSDPNLDLQCNAEVHSLGFEGSRATAVHWAKRGKRRSSEARRGIIVAAGTMGSPWLLLRSGIGPAEQLRAAGISVISDVAGVGSNLQDHPAVMVTFNLTQNTFGSDAGPLRGFPHLLNFIFRGRGPITTSIGHAQAFIRTSSQMSLPNIQLITSPFAYDFDESGAKLVRGRAMGPAIGLMRPRSRGSLELNTANPFGRPIINHPMLGNRGDVEELIAGIQFVRQMMEKPPMGLVLEGERNPGSSIKDDEQLEKFVRDTCFSMYHQVGTCKMGVDQLAVVDPQLKVRGVDNLWVADASIMPDLPSGNTNATTIMIGDRASDIILAAA
jgi:choline dehydrogenase